MHKTINSSDFRNMILVGAKQLEINRAKVDALNVFPVPIEKKARGAFDVRSEDETISCVAIKKADDREAVIFRLLNNTDECVNSAISVNGEKLLLSFGKFEVKTVLWENGQLWESAELII